jgi:hypothetical protein
MDTTAAPQTRSPLSISDYVLVKDDKESEYTNASIKTVSFWEDSCGLWFEWVHTFAGSLVTNLWFQKTIVVMIIINSILMGLDTFDFITENPTVNQAFDLIDYIFLLLFTVELAFQFLWQGLALFRDGWLVFDFVVIVLSWVFIQLQVIRAFRVVRAFRMITRIQELKDLVHALLGVIPRLFAIGLLLLLVFYVFAVMMTQLFADLYEEGYTDIDYFSRLDWTLFTLFQIMTGDSWSSITRQCMARYSWAWIPMISFVALSSFIVINLIIAVICDAVASLQTEHLERQFKEVDEQRNNCSNLENYDYTAMDKDAHIAKLEQKVDAMYEMLKEMQAELRQENPFVR